jgi:hypothetical protein
VKLIPLFLSERLFRCYLASLKMFSEVVNLRA